MKAPRKPFGFEGEALNQLSRRSEELARKLVADFPADVLARLLAIEVMSSAAAAGGSMTIVVAEERLLIERARAWKALMGGDAADGFKGDVANAIKVRATLRKVAG